MDWYAQKIGREVSLHKAVNWLKQNNKLREIILRGLNPRLKKLLIKEIPKTLCKDKRKRKTTQEYVEMEIFYIDLYTNVNENQWIRVA